MKSTLRHLLVGLSLIATTSSLALIQTTTTKHLQTVYNQAMSLDPANTLVIFDIDNTLLRTKTTLGSPQWFNWQSQEIASHAPDALTDSMASFFPINDFVLRLVHTKPCEPQTNTSAYLSTQQVISRLQDKGYTVIAESAREPAVRFTTEKQLANNQIFFQPAFTPLCNHIHRLLSTQVNRQCDEHRLLQWHSLHHGCAKSRTTQPVVDRP